MADAPSLHETLEAAITASQETPEPTQEGGDATDSTISDPVESATPAAADVAEKAAAERARDEKGRFAPKAEATKKTEAAPDAKKPAPEAGAKVQAKAGGEASAPPLAAVAEKPPEHKAPQSWKPQAREAFAKAPPEVQAEVARREADITRTLNETAQARQVAQQTYQALAPYEGIARAAGMDAWSWAGQALQERAQLQMGPVAQRAPILARMLAEGGQELIQHVASLLDGQAVPQQAAAPQPVNIDALVDQKFAQRFQQLESAQADQAVKAFLETKPEFINDVAQQMGALITFAKGQGRNMTLQQAYDEACWANPDVRVMLQSRKAAEVAKAQASTLPRSKAAAVSIRGTPAQPVVQREGKRSVREDLEDAIAQSSRT